MKVSLLKSLRFRIPLLVLAGTVPLILVAILYSSDRASKKISQEAKENIALKAELLAESINRWNESNVLALHNLSKQPDVVSMDPTKQKPVLSNIAENYKHIYLAVTVDKNGQVLARNDNKKLGGYGDRYWFQGAMAGNSVTYQALISRTIKKPALCLSAPIRQNNLTVVGVTALCTDLEAIVTQIGKLRFGETGYAFLVNRNGIVLAHPNPEFVSGRQLKNLKSDPPERDSAPVEHLLSDEGGNFSFRDEKNIKWFSYGTRLQNGWGIVVVQKESELFENQEEFQRLAFLVATTAVLGVSILTWLIANRLIQPIDRLTETAVAISKGQLDRRVEINRQDELGILAESFDEMANQLKSFFELLKYQIDDRTVRLKKAQEAALLTHQNTDKFLASVSSEIRIFLNSILSYTNILKREGYLIPRQLQVLSLIEQSSNHILTLVNDTLNFSKTEVDNIEINPADVYLSDMLEGIANIINNLAVDKGLVFNFIPRGKLPSVVKADEKRLRQVLINLLSNAVQYTASGRVTLKVSLIESYSDSSENSSDNNSILEQKLRFEVIDTGKGIDNQQLDKMLIPLENIESSEYKINSEGLGLAIIRKILEMMGSKLEIKTELGKGSRFRFELILPVVNSSPELEADRIIEEVLGYKGKRRKLLVVDDKEEDSSLLFNILSSLGFEVVTSNNGKEMLKIVSSIEPDLIFLDLFMPIKSGVSSVKELRQIPKLKNVPVILLSSSSMTEKLCQYFGCEAYLKKPFDRKELMDLLKQHLNLEWIIKAQNFGSTEPLT